MPEQHYPNYIEILKKHIFKTTDQKTKQKKQRTLLQFRYFFSAKTDMIEINLYIEEQISNMETAKKRYDETCFL